MAYGYYIPDDHEPCPDCGYDNCQCQYLDWVYHMHGPEMLEPCEKCEEPHCLCQCPVPAVEQQEQDSQGKVIHWTHKTFGYPENWIPF